MTNLAAKTAGVLAVGIGLMLTGAPAAIAQTTQPAQRVETTEGAHIATRARGRVGGHHFRGGDHRFRGGGHHFRGHAYRGYRGRHIGGGIAAGIAGAIILNEIYRSSRPTYYYDDGGLSCEQLEARCEAGHDWACRRLDRYC